MPTVLVECKLIAVENELLCNRMWALPQTLLEEAARDLDYNFNCASCCNSSLNMSFGTLLLDYGT